MGLGSRTHIGTAANDAMGGGDEFDDFMYGLHGNDMLAGFGRNDHLFGGHGDDILTGGAGIDFLIGGPGADRLDGGDSRDYADYSSNSRGITVSLAGGEGVAHGGGATGDTLFSIEAVIGTAFDDTLTGGRGKQVFDGRDGNDHLSGGSHGDELSGGDGDDVLDGGDGSEDYLFGGAGDDWLLGGAGNDYLAGGTGVDTVDGGDGFDFYAAGYGTPEAITVDLMRPERNAGLAEGDILTGIEGLQGGVGNDTLLGDANDNTIYGGGGVDVLHGRQGNDRLIGGDQADRLYGGDGEDMLYSGAGLLDGGAGDDMLGMHYTTWHTEGQRMRGGEGADTFFTTTNNWSPAVSSTSKRGSTRSTSTGASPFPQALRSIPVTSRKARKRPTRTTSSSTIPPRAGCGTTTMAPAAIRCCFSPC